MTKFLQTLGLLVCFVTNAAFAEVPELHEGDIPPQKVGTRVDGTEVELSNLIGKAVVVTFWATWCPNCLEELPILANIQRLAGKDRLQVIAVNIEEHDAFRRAAHALKNVELLLTNESDDEAKNAYGVTSIPHMLIIGRDGKIIRIYHGYDKSSLKNIAADINVALGATQ